MNKIVKVSAFALAIIVNVSCSGMMTLFQKNDSPQLLQNDCLVGICRQITHRPTQLNARATSRLMRDNIEIEELEDARSALRSERIFLLSPQCVMKDKYLNENFTKTQADALGFNYLPDSFTADGAWVRDVVDVNGFNYDHALWSSAINYARNNDDQLILQNYNDFRKTLSLASKLGDHKAQKNLVLAHIPHNKYGLKYLFFQNLLCPAMAQGDHDFAKDLIKTNPYGYSGGRDHSGPHYYPELTNYIKSIPSEQLPEKKKKEFVALCEKQSYCYRQKHEHCAIL